MGLISEQPKRPLEPWIIKLFKLIDVEKKKKKTKPELLEFITGLAPYMNIPEGYELFLLDLYSLNYREDGDYSKLDKENYIDPRAQKGKTTSNPKAWKYAQVQLPFKGSNMRGFWEKDRFGNDQYVVTSYNWYPIYIFKNDKWYEVTQRYSSSTSRQMSNVNPVTYNRNLDQKVMTLSGKEMEKLRAGYPEEEVLKMKFKGLKDMEQKFQQARTQWFAPWDWEQPKVVIKYKIDSVDLDSEKPTLVVNVADVIKKEGNKRIPTPENYTKGEIPGITKEYIEDKIKNRLIGKLYDFMGARYGTDKDKFLVDFRFNHLKEKE